jgi:DNA-binding FrmR family transcriptional regulator
MRMNTKESIKSFPENQESNYLSPKDRISIQMRLNRIEGQVRGVQRQMERDEYCDQILNQVEAIHSALSAVGILVMSNHLKSYAARTDLKNRESITQEMLKILSILMNRKDEEK